MEVGKCFFRQNIYMHVNRKLIYSFKAFLKCCGEKMENKKNDYRHFRVANLCGGSLFLNIDELLAFRYFESVIMVPKVRTHFNQYCHGRPSNIVVKYFLNNCSLSEVEKIKVLSFNLAAVCVFHE